jgi:hypothetical protein
VIGLINAEQAKVGLAAELHGPAAGVVRVIDLGDALDPSPSAGMPVGTERLRCRPLRALLAGVETSAFRGEGAGRGGGAVLTLLAAAKEEQACVLMGSPDAPDLVDAQITESGESNHVYGRFATRGGQGDSSALRGAFVGEVLARFDFATAWSGRAVTGWRGGQSGRETETTLELVGRLGGCLARLDAVGWDEGSMARSRDSFLRPLSRASGGGQSATPASGGSSGGSSATAGGGSGG